ncbi:hypothetical protein PF001_g15037 [Phytophthora fragariae]|uniref:Uncharacterized protein n=1 Tax=Phytophthora fragariae TaxID=53985 RepID=A0A6A3THU4_9STRA|nr:hypothetical protein PF006_g14875 [Phytophthora fragariae]KAE9300275.1 hypothetical protein PF001_g15037 [Phytophthora fragariae]
MDAPGMSISIHLTSTDRKGSSTVGSTIVASTAPALKSFRVPGRGPVMSVTGMLDSGFDFFRSSTKTSAISMSLARSSAVSASSSKGLTVKRLLLITLLPDKLGNGSSTCTVQVKDKVDASKSQSLASVWLATSPTRRLGI